MTLEDELNDAAEKGVKSRVKQNLPHTQLSDYPEEELELIGSTSHLNNLNVYKWSDGQNTLYLIHREEGFNEPGITLITLAPDYAKTLSKLLGEASE